MRIILLLALAGLADAADPTAVRAPLQPETERKAAAGFILRDSDGKMADLKKYRGKVVVVDFWATWCTGCKTEIPWFAEFQKRYGAEGLNVIGVSLDEDGWKVLTPFLAAHKVPYRMVLGNQATAQSYGIDNMPDTFLIDRKGRVAAAYRAGLVDRGDIERNIQALLSER